jgi:hypothetical protein
MHVAVKALVPIRMSVMWKFYTGNRPEKYLSGFGVPGTLLSLIAAWAAKNYNKGSMRIVAGCLLVAAGSVFLMQSSRDLHNQYGEPDRERFTARPGISLTVEYGSDHLACYALIEPPLPLTYTEENVPLMSSEGVSEVLEEVAPIAMRGKEIGDGGFQSGCNVARITDYENVSIMRSTHTCDPSSHDQDVRTAITFKRETCPKPRTPLTVTRP